MKGGSPLLKLRGLGLIAGILLLTTGPGLADQSPTEWLDSAIEAYQKGMDSSERAHRLQFFSESERLFAAAIERGAESSDLWANRGSAALQAERLGPAILSYRRALILDPGHERASQNLAHARGLLPDWIPTPAKGGFLDSFFFWHRTLSLQERQDAATACFVLAAIFMSISVAFRIHTARYPGLLLILGWLGLSVSLFFDSENQAAREGVVVASEIAARAADSVIAPLRFGESLPGGTEVRILEDRGGWLHIELHNGRDAWVIESSIERVSTEKS